MKMRHQSGNVDEQDWIGYRFLALRYGIEPAQPFPVVSRMGKSRATVLHDGQRTEVFTEPYRPQPSLAGHLTFALKHEGVHLEFLARLFAELPPGELEDWIRTEPTGQYARRAGFFYEWLTGRSLDCDDVQIGNYVLALPEEGYLTRSVPVKVSRWRVRDNLPGTRSYCPTIRRTPSVLNHERLDCEARLQELEATFGKETLQKSSVWLSIRESRGSFQIEQEDSQTDRVRRFAMALEQRLGEPNDPLDPGFLASLQADILGHHAHRTGIRKSPVYVGESGLDREIVHYIAPHWKQVAEMLEGLREFAASTNGRSPLCRAAVLSFGFVFLHPMADGNGRISRFLINDTLRRDGATPAPYILPVSATITRTFAHRAAYDQVLERYSKNLIRRYANAWRFGQMTTCEDGVQSNFYFDAYDDARFVWAFPDLTAQSEYLGEVIRETLELELPEEARYLRDLYDARARVKLVFEVPDNELDRLIRSIREMNGSVSGKLVAEFPALQDAKLAKAVIQAALGPSDER